MSALDMSQTSAAGPMRKRAGTQLLYILPFGLTLPGTSSGSVGLAQEAAPQASPWESTSAGIPVGPVEDAGHAIAELRRITGLTWDQLARLFGVSRRAIHFWAAGKMMNSTNEERLARILAVARGMDRGSVQVNRAAIVAVHADGSCIFELLAAGEYERAASVGGVGESRRMVRPKPSAATLAARAPRAPEVLVDTLEDGVPRGRGRLLGTTPVKVTRRK